MAQRRMFSKSIVDTDAFLEMPPTSQLLYFHFNMHADDDGFVGNPKKIMRSCGFGEDDIKILLAKRFILGFESGVVVIKHWRINNYLQNDRCKPTSYQEELKRLELKDNGSYTECIQSVSKLDSQYSIVKDRIGKNSIAKDNLDFDLFWNLYDKKINKDKCLIKWNKLDIGDQQKILDYLPKYKQATPEKKFRKNPETFFNNRSWCDEVVGEGEPDKPTTWAGDIALYGDDDIEDKLTKGVIKFNQITKKYEKV